MSASTGTRGLPLGVAILAVLLGIYGAIVLILGLVVVVASLLNIGLSGFTTTFGTSLLSGLITFVIGVVILAVAFGLWDQALWAFVLALIAVIVSFVWFVGRPIYDGAGLSSIINVPAIVSIVLLIYLVLVSDHFY
jgi:hypothetical protein